MATAIALLGAAAAVALGAACSATSAASARTQACLTYGCDSARTGRFDVSSHVTSSAKYLNVDLGSAVRGAPLFLPSWKLHSGPLAGRVRNLVLVTTSDNHVYAFAEESLLRGDRRPLWSQSLGSPSANGCSNLPPPPIGISSTPVIDPARRMVFVLALVDDGSRSLRCVDISRGTGAHSYGHASYYIYALDLDTGVVVARARLHDGGGAGRPTFDANLEDQRGGLNLVNGRIYAVFGGLYYHDLCAYHGWIVSIDSHNLSDQVFFPLTRRVLGGGSWGPGGAAAAPDGTVYVATGNAPISRDRPGPDVVPCCPPPPASYADRATYWARLPAGVHPGDEGEFFLALVRLSLGFRGAPPTPVVSAIDWFQPEDAESLNERDLEMGSSSPLLIPRIGGRELLVVGAKDGSVFLLDRRKLGRWGHPVARVKVFSGGAKGAPAYVQLGNRHLVFVSGSGIPGLACYEVETSQTGANLVERWRAGGKGIRFGKYPGSPMVAKAPGSATVWIVDGHADPAAPGVLRAFDAGDGALVYDSSRRASDNLGPVPRFPNLGFGSRSVFVGTSKGFACYRLTTVR